MAKRANFGKNNRTELVCVPPKRKRLIFSDAHALKTREQTPEPRWSVTAATHRDKLVTGRRSLHLLRTNMQPASSREPHAYARRSCCFTCHSQFITHLRARTHAHTQNEQQRLLMSRNAHRSVEQHDSCRSRRSSYWTAVVHSQRCPQSDNGTPGFSRHGCINTLETGKQRGERSWGERRSRG